MQSIPDVSRGLVSVNEVLDILPVAHGLQFTLTEHKETTVMNCRLLQRFKLATLCASQPGNGKSLLRPSGEKLLRCSAKPGVRYARDLHSCSHLFTLLLRLAGMSMYAAPPTFCLIGFKSVLQHFTTLSVSANHARVI